MTEDSKADSSQKSDDLSAVLMTRQTCSKHVNCSAKVKTARDGHLNRILISSRFSNCSKITKPWNDGNIAISQSTKLRKLQLRYDRDCKI